MLRPFAVGSSSLREAAQEPGTAGRSVWARLLGWGRKRKANRHSHSATSHLPGLRLEPLEPRFLLSADIIPFRIDMTGDASGAHYSLKYDNLIQAVQVFDDRTGMLIDSRSAQDINFIQVVGTAANDRLTVDFAKEFLQGIEIDFEGGDGDDVLALSGGDVTDVTVTMTGDGAGAVTVNGAAGAQTIGFTGVGTISDTNAAGNRIFRDATGQGQTLRIGDNGTVGDGVSSIDAIGAGGALTYNFLHPDVTLTVDAGAGDDTFVHGGFETALAGKILLSGGAGGDAVTGPPANTTWSITGQDSGSVSGVSFVEVENLRGSADNEDTFVVSAGGAISGVIDGGAGGTTAAASSAGFTSAAHSSTRLESTWRTSSPSHSTTSSSSSVRASAGTVWRIARYASLGYRSTRPSLRPS